MSSALDAWVHLTTEIPEGGLTRERAASEAERRAIASVLGLPDVGRLAATYRISAITGGGWRLKGHLSADITQNCVVTLEPVAQMVEDDFDVEFWREAAPEDGGEDQSVLVGPDVERFDGEKIDAGRIVFETLSAALDPYPRKAGVEFDWADKAAANPEKTSPFAVLSRLKDRK